MRIRFPSYILSFALLAFAVPDAARAATLFTDDFTRGTDPGPLTPWVARAGAWSVTGGLLLGGSNAPSTYGYVYLTNTWTDSSVQALLTFPAGAFGGGLATRLNTNTGARYAAWIYPEGSPGGSNVLRLLKFQDWANFTIMQQANLPGVGTAPHTLKLVARGNRVAAHYDGDLVASATDTDAQPFLSGGVGVETWTDGTLYVLSVDDVLVATLSGVSASNDTYIVRQGGSLAVAAPGVLDNDVPEVGPLTALLSTGPAHGTLNLSTNGGFSYLPVTTYVGPDAFTYRATDGSTTSGVATVTITVTADHAPNATTDSYTLMANTMLTVPAGGVLTNDSDADGDRLTAVLATGPTKGSLSLSADGSFTYVPSANYVGNDSFTYLASDGLSNSSPATVNISVTAFAPLFSDSFTRASLSPWIVQDGNWALNNNVLVGGTNAANGYGHAYVTNSWSDYSVQARVQFSTNGFGGGVSGRLNPVTGARYSAWVYPEGSPGGSSVLKLLKFQSWSQFTVLQQVNLPGVGTNWHTVELAMRSNRLAVRYDDTIVLSLSDSAPQLLSGCIGLDLWTQASPWIFYADDVSVSPIINVLATNDSYTVPMSSTLTVPFPGVLGNDAADLGFTAVQASGVGHGTLLFNANGSFVYAPTVGYAGPDSFTYRATDGFTTSAVATVSLTVTAPGVLFTDDFTRVGPPVLSPWLVRTGNWAIASGVLQGGTNSLLTYGQAYLATNWGDCDIQARIQLPAGAYGGGLAGRLNPATGTRYGLWIYPEGSSGGSNVWKLLRFQNWEAFTVMQQGNLPGVGTIGHTLRLWLQGSSIRLYFDGTQLTSVSDPLPYLTGGVSVEMWTAGSTYVMSADDVQVTGLPPDLTVAAVGIVAAPNNQALSVTFRGAPGGLYMVQAATNISPLPNWLTLSTNVAGTDGRWTITDSLTSAPSRYYRAIRP